MNQSSLSAGKKTFGIPPDVAVPRPDEVQAYLEGHPDLAAVVPTVCQYTRAEFGEQPALSLEVYHDPEIEDSHLALYLRLFSYDPNLFSRIDNVWDRVEKDRGVDLCAMSGWMTIHPEFRKPNAAKPG